MLAHRACAISNPFCDQSKGTKYPDASSAFTLAYPMRYRLPVLTNASGTAVVIATGAFYTNNTPVPPTLQYTVSSATVDATGTILTFGSAIGQPFGDIMAGNSVRIVSAGVKFTPSQSLMTAQGLVNIIEVPASDDIDVEYAGLSLGSQSYPTYNTMPLRSSDSLYGILRPSGAQARTFNPVGDWSTSVKSTNDWSSIAVFVQGGPATSTVGYIDVFYNLELQLDSVAARTYRPLLSAAPGSSQTLVALSSELLKHPPILRGDDAKVDSTFFQNALSALKTAGSAAWEHRADIRDLALTGAAIYSGNYPAAGAIMTQATIRNVD